MSAHVLGVLVYLLAVSDVHVFLPAGGLVCLAGVPCVLIDVLGVVLGVADWRG